MRKRDVITTAEAQLCVAVMSPGAETLPAWRADKVRGKPNETKECTAKKALAAEKRRLEHVCVSSRVALWVWNIPSGTVEWSGSVEPGHRIGVFPHTFEAWRSLLHPDDKDHFTEALNQHLRNKAPCEIYCRVQCAVGDFAMWHLTGVAECDDHGQPVRVVGTCMDATDRKKAAVARRRVEESYLSLFENMLNGFAYCRMLCEQDQPLDFIFLAVNKAFENLTGLRNVAGRKASEVVPGIQEKDPELLKALGRVARIGVPEKFETYVESMKMWLAVSVYRPEEGDFVVVFDVITERKRVEEERTRLFTAVEQAAETVVITDAQGTILYANTAFERTTGYTRQEALGQKPSILKSGKQDAAFYKQLWDTLMRGEVWQGHFINKKKDGTIYEEDATLSPVRNSAGQTVNFVGIKLDVSHEVAMEAQLRQSQKMEAIGTLAGGVAHEINNPINGIMNYAQLVADELPANNDLQLYLANIMKETNRVSVIVRNLLAFARQDKQAHSPADPADIIQATLSLLQTVIRHDQILLNIEVPPGLPKMECRSQQIEQVLMNLLTNARDALNDRYPAYHEDKIIRVSARPFEKNGSIWIQMTVEDHGNGIPAGVRDRIFDPFYTTKPMGRGTGLGLSISYGIVKDHGGCLHMETEPGHFTRFHVDLPATASEETRTKDFATSPKAAVG